ncbi:MAG: hypothetical protein ACTH0M_09690, partial [Brevibacterium yomogidense]
MADAVQVHADRIDAVDDVRVAGAGHELQSTETGAGEASRHLIVERLDDDLSSEWAHGVDELVHGLRCLQLDEQDLARFLIFGEQLIHEQC